MAKKINELIFQLESLLNQISTEKHEEEIWRGVLEKGEVEDVHKITLVECHVINYIGNNRLTNSVGIAHNMQITKGGISKITSRLLKKELIEAHRLEGNRKEVFYTLTPVGKKIFVLHEKLHAKVQARLENMLQKYNKKELNVISHFLKNLKEII